MSNVHYLPTLAELSVSIGIFAGGILAFGLAARYLPLFESEESHVPAPLRNLTSTTKAVAD